MSAKVQPGPFAVRLCNYVGDVLLSLPALQLLHDHGLHLRLIGKAWVPTLLSAYDWPCSALPRGFGERVRALKALRQACTEADAGFARRPVNALVTPNSLSSAAELRLAGFHPSGVANEGRALFLNQRQAPSAATHKLEWFWALACQLLGVKAEPPRSIGLRLRPQAVDAAATLIRHHDLEHGFIAIAPFAGGDVEGQNKKWPRFAELGAQLDRLALPLVVCPGTGEEAMAREQYPLALSLNGVPLDTYAALLARCHLMIANDTGPAHLAAAVGAPLLSVLGPTRPEVWAPWGPSVTVLRRWPEWPSADEVLHAARIVLSSTQRVQTMS